MFDCLLCDKISMSSNEISHHINGSSFHQERLEMRREEKAAPQKSMFIVVAYFVFHEAYILISTVEFHQSQNEISSLEKALYRTDLKVVGLEYVIELIRGHDSIYRCVLCESCGVENTIIDHLYSLSHCNRYLVLIAI